MQRVPLGGSGIAVSRLCLGGNVFGWKIDEQQSFAVLDAYAEAGGNFFDTSDQYSAAGPGQDGGDSEKIIGRWAGSRGKRDEVVIATKIGAAGGLGATNVRARAEASLRRLGVDHVDVLFAHLDDLATPLEETLGALDALVREGKARCVGASNFSAARLADALEVSRREGLVRFEALQPHYNLLERRALFNDRFATGAFEGALRDVCRDAGIAVIPYWVLAKGFLTGKYRLASAPDAPDERTAAMLDSLARDPRNGEVVDVVLSIAEGNDLSPTSVVIAWTLAQPGITSALASARNPEQLSDVLSGARIRLSKEDLARLDAASAPSEAA